MSTRKKLLQKENRIRDRTFRKNLKGGIHWLHNKTVKNMRKGQHLDNQELKIRNNIPQNDNRKKEH